MTDVRSIDIRNFTQIDLAYIDAKGLIRGNSFRVDAVVTGKVDENEKVVIDFSACKKIMKQLIDDPVKGYDHKLWIYNDSKVEVSTDFPSDMCVVRTPFAYIQGDRNMIRVVDADESNVDGAIASYLQTSLREFYGDHIDVDVRLSRRKVRSHDLSRIYSFSYVHGLKDSTSYGCQNIAHGHHSFIEAKWDDIQGMNHRDLVDVEYHLGLLADKMHNTIFIKQENIYEYRLADDGTSWVTLEYKSQNRGLFRMSINTDVHKIKVLETETTVEYLADYVAEQLRGKTKLKQIFVSEGLTKGALVKL